MSSYIKFQSKRHEKLVRRPVKLGSTRLVVATAVHLIMLPNLAHIQTTLGNLKSITQDSWSKVQTVLDITGLWLTARQHDDGRVNSGVGWGEGAALAVGGRDVAVKMSCKRWGTETK